MKHFFLIALLLVGSPIFAAETTPPATQEMPEHLKEWESQVAVREAKEDAVYGELWSKTLLLLIAILAFLFIATWFMKRFDRFKLKPNNQITRINLVEKKVLSPKSVLYLIEIDGNKIALSESATNGVQVLHTLTSQKNSEIA